MASSDHDHVRQYVATELSDVYGFDIPGEVVQGVMSEIFPRFPESTRFMKGYFIPTITKLKDLKERGIPLHYGRKLVILLSKPTIPLRDGDFFFQAGVTTPGTISVKYCYGEELNLTMMKSKNLHRMLDKCLYAEMCKEAHLPGNIFLQLVTSGESGYSFVPVSELETLAASKQVQLRDRVNSDLSDLSYHSPGTPSRRKPDNMPELCSQLLPTQIDIICEKLNQKGPQDWRILAQHLLKYDYAQVSTLRQMENPCQEVLDRWMAEKGEEATTASLLEVLNVFMQRRDVVLALKNSGAVRTRRSPPLPSLAQSNVTRKHQPTVSRSASVPHHMTSPRNPVKQSSTEDEVFASETTQPTPVFKESDNLSSTSEFSQASNSGQYPELQDDVARKGKEPSKQVSSEIFQAKSDSSCYPTTEDRMKAAGRQLHDVPVPVAPESNSNPYPTTEDSLQLKASGRQLCSSSPADQAGSDTQSQMVLEQRLSKMSTTEKKPYQEESGVVVATTDNAKPLSKEADELATLAQVAAGGGMQSDISSTSTQTTNDDDPN